MIKVWTLQIGFGCFAQADAPLRARAGLYYLLSFFEIPSSSAPIVNSKGKGLYV
jgi:hypothetical protein